MTLINSLKQPFKQARWQLRRRQAASRWSQSQMDQLPAVVGNAMPKSGSHLLIQVLQGLTQLGPFVDPGMPPLSRSADNVNLPDEAVVANLHQLGSGDIAYCYLHARQPFLSELASPGVASFFIYRDPRDVIVSQVFYATDMHEGHGMHRYYNQQLSTMEQRINAAIRGVNTSEAHLSPIKTKYEHYLGWLQQPQVLCLRFEDLILDRQDALGRVLGHMESRGFKPQVSRSQAVETLAGAIAPRTSGTFRRGQPGEWKEQFTAENKRIFKDATGDLLVCLGYEKDSKW